MEEKVRRKKRKTSPRPTRYRGRLKRPGTAAAHRKLWADPEYRAMMTEKRKAAGLARRGQPGAREGIPDGMRKAEADKLNQEAQVYAEKKVAELKEAGLFDGDDTRAAEAMQVTIQIMKAPGDKKVRLAAAKQVLEFTKSKPASKSNVTINKAEEWLAAIASENDDDEGKAAQDA